MAADHDRRSSDRANRSGRRALHEALQARVVLVATDHPPRDDDEQVGRREDGDRRDHGAGDSVDQIARERRHDHDRPRADQAHRDGVDELPLGEPVMVVDEALVQERHDREPGSERERAGLCEEQAHRPKGRARPGPGESAHRGDDRLR